jgi:hypothetical protein
VTEYFEENEQPDDGSSDEIDDGSSDQDDDPPKASGGVDPLAAIGSLFGELEGQAEEQPVQQAEEQPVQQAEEIPIPENKLTEEEPAHSLVQDQFTAETAPSAEVCTPTDSSSISGKPRRYRLTRRMLARIADSIPVLRAAIAAKLKHVSLTDPDARMMGYGRHKIKDMCHSYEAATDNGFLVSGGTSNCAADTSRLLAIVENAKQGDPTDITHVDADSGYFSGRAVGALLLEGLDVCIPNAFTACDIRRGLPHGTTASALRGSVPMEYNAVNDQYTCPEGNVLQLKSTQRNRGSDRKVYRAKNLCTGCPLKSECMVNVDAKYRNLYVTIDFDLLKEYQERFKDADHRARYHHRAPAIETVFAVIRQTMGVNQWSVRGAKRVEAESQIISAAYQLRKLHALMYPTITNKQARTRSLQSLQPQRG